MTKPPSDAKAGDAQKGGAARYGPGERARLVRNRAAGATHGRRLSAGRRLYYAVGKPLFESLVRLWWASCRLRVIEGEEHFDAAIRDGKPVIPCYWHQQSLFGARFMLGQLKRGLKVGFLVSPSVDGEVPASIVQHAGASVIRGSSTRTGAQALREMYLAVAKDGTSLVTTADGPRGPAKEFKVGAVNLAKLSGAPLIPLACAAKRAWYLDRWDRFMVPKPFTAVTIAVGTPIYVDKRADEVAIKAAQRAMEDAISQLESNAAAALSKS
ncbi:MAG: lysophospholipid acyltransferase family protein [Pseudomonadota bacterium]